MDNAESAAGAQQEAHLVCSGCEQNPTVAMLDGNEVLVCHCTGVDGDLDPVTIHGFDSLPNQWKFLDHQEAERVVCMGCGDSVTKAEAKRRPADGTPSCPGCSRPYYDPYLGPDTGGSGEVDG